MSLRISTRVQPSVRLRKTTPLPQSVDPLAREGERIHLCCVYSYSTAQRNLSIHYTIWLHFHPLTRTTSLFTQPQVKYTIIFPSRYRHQAKDESHRWFASFIKETLWSERSTLSGGSVFHRITISKSTFERNNINGQRPAFIITFHWNLLLTGCNSKCLWDI